MAGNCRFTVAAHICAVLVLNPRITVTSDFIAGSVNTNPVVLRRILAALARAGLVTSKRGQAGGYHLALAPSEIDLARIARAVDDDDRLVFTPNPPNPVCPVSRSIRPILTEAIGHAERAREAELSKVRLSDIIARLRM